MRRGLLSLAALVLSLPVLWAAAMGTQSVEAAAIRLLVLAVGVSIIDKHVFPLVMVFVRTLGVSTRREEISS